MILGIRENNKVFPIYWESGVMRKVCTSPKAAETRGVMELVDDGVNTFNQLKILINDVVNFRVFTDLRLLLETTGSSSQWLI